MIVVCPECSKETIIPDHPVPKVTYRCARCSARLTGRGTSGLGGQAEIPPEIRGWNWGAFSLNMIWGIGNNVWIALLCLIPFFGIVMTFVLGAKGNEWAWQNKKWDSIEHFKSSQRKWALWGLVISVFPILVWVILLIIVAAQI